MTNQFGSSGEINGQISEIKDLMASLQRRLEALEQVRRHQVAESRSAFEDNEYYLLPIGAG